MANSSSERRVGAVMFSVGAYPNGNNQRTVTIRANQVAMPAIVLQALVHISGLRYFISYPPDGRL
ncbi:hypothetical protein B195_001580 [Pseudomonas sp. Lz4W]|jgi:hypothetical protein|nr:hypothetical protein AV641_01575 [Pseudomonas fragi]AUB73570.1 hypothetical protein B195_001580 [Pseudomonas sp. Lz4W]RUT36791.1 hypothetical protein WG29040_16145 [Pseudomonas sp. PAMC 29040]